MFQQTLFLLFWREECFFFHSRQHEAETVAVDINCSSALFVSRYRVPEYMVVVGGTLSVRVWQEL